MAFHSTVDTVHCALSSRQDSNVLHSQWGGGGGVGVVGAGG